MRSAGGFPHLRRAWARNGRSVSNLHTNHPLCRGARTRILRFAPANGCKVLAYSCRGIVPAWVAPCGGITYGKHLLLSGTRSRGSVGRDGAKSDRPWARCCRNSSASRDFSPACGTHPGITALLGRLPRRCSIMRHGERIEHFRSVVTRSSSPPCIMCFRRETGGLTRWRTAANRATLKARAHVGVGVPAIVDADNAERRWRRACRSCGVWEGSDRQPGWITVRREGGSEHVRTTTVKPAARSCTEYTPPVPRKPVVHAPPTTPFLEHTRLVPVERFSASRRLGAPVFACIDVIPA